MTDSERIAALELRLAQAEARIAVLEARGVQFVPTWWPHQPQPWQSPWYCAPGPNTAGMSAI